MAAMSHDITMSPKYRQLTSVSYNGYTATCPILDGDMTLMPPCLLVGVLDKVMLLTMVTVYSIGPANYPLQVLAVLNNKPTACLPVVVMVTPSKTSQFECGLRI